MLRVTREGDMTKSVFPGFKKAVEGLSSRSRSRVVRFPESTQMTAIIDACIDKADICTDSLFALIM